MLLPPLTDVEVRILGALVEKESTTPDTYPLSLGALTAACTQTSNRDPVMQLDEGAVTESIVSLRRRSLLRAIQPAGSRVTKYQHLLADALSLGARELAVLGVLALRGPQTPGELHVRTGRLAAFADLADLQATIDALVAREPEALVARLPRRPGQKEVRYAHLLAGEPAPSGSTAPPAGPAPSVANVEESTSDDRIATLEREVTALRADLAALAAHFQEFRAQFQ